MSDTEAEIPMAVSVDVGGSTGDVAIAATILALSERAAGVVRRALVYYSDELAEFEWESEVGYKAIAEIDEQLAKLPEVAS